MNAKTELVPTIAERKAALAAKTVTTPKDDIVAAAAQKQADVKSLAKKVEKKITEKKVEKKPAAKQQVTKAEPEKKKSKPESRAALEAKFAAGAAATFTGESSATKPWLTARTPLTVIGVIKSHAFLFVKLTAIKNGKEVTIHLAPHSCAPQKKVSK